MKLFALAVEAVPDSLTQVLQDALAMHSTAGYVIAGVLALCILVPLVLKALGKSVPLLDPALAILSSILKGLVKKPAPAPQPEPTPEERKEEGGVSNVVNIKEEK